MELQKQSSSVLHDEILQLRLQNLQLEKELESQKQKCVSLEPQTFSEENPTPATDTAILRQRCKQLRANIDCLDHEKFPSLPDSDDVRYMMLRENYSRYLQQLEDCFGFLQYTKHETDGEIKREQKTNMELHSLISAAEEKLTDTGQEEKSKKNVYKRLEAKCSALEKKNTAIGKKMTLFLGKYFPLPNKEDFMKVKKKMEIEAKSVEDLLPLNDIVQELMNLCVENPNDPYLGLNHRHWPPYIELLLQCEIALRHPSDTKRIKLMPYHL